MNRKPNLLGRIFTGLSFFFLYAPIFVLIAFSFNSSKSRSIWTGFSLQWYEALMENEAILNALKVTLTVSEDALLVVNNEGNFVAEGSPVLYVGVGQPDSRTLALTGHEALSIEL